MSDSFLFKTPTLKSLVGTFMTEQGAPKGDISEVENYYSTKKSAKIQMLDQLSNEAQPRPVQGEDLAWRPANEVVSAAFQPLVKALTPPQPESVSEAAVDPLGSNMPSDVMPSDDLMPKSEVGLSESSPSEQAFGTDQVYIGMGDGSGQSTKAQMQQLWNAARSDDELDLSSGRRPFVRDERAFRKANDKWMKKVPSYWNKAPVQQLYSLPPQFRDHKPRGTVPVWNPGPMGTNHAFLSRRSDAAGRSWYQGVGDGSGVSTKARLQLLAQSAGRGPHVVRIPDAGEAGTDMAFLAEKTNPAGGRWLEGVGDGDGQST